MQFVIEFKQSNSDNTTFQALKLLLLALFQSNDNVLIVGPKSLQSLTLILSLQLSSKRLCVTSMIYKYHCGTARQALEDKPSTLIHPAASNSSSDWSLPSWANNSLSWWYWCCCSCSCRNRFNIQPLKSLQKLELISGGESLNPEARCCAHALPIAIFKSSHNAPVCVSGM